VEPTVAKSLLPNSLVSQAQSQSRGEFVEAIDTPLLLIRVGGADTELALGLSEAPTAGGTRLLPTLGFNTIVGEAPEPSKRFVAPASRAFDGARVAFLLAQSLYFAAPLRKRTIAGKPFAERISVGRATNNDIVLRDGSVSKFHAWFECDDDDAYYVGDARSTNTTALNGTVVTGSELVRLRPGDELRFGAVEAVLCPPDILWDALVG